MKGDIVNNMRILVKVEEKDEKLSKLNHIVFSVAEVNGVTEAYFSKNHLIFTFENDQFNALCVNCDSDYIDRTDIMKNLLKYGYVDLSLYEAELIDISEINKRNQEAILSIKE